MRIDSQKFGAEDIVYMKRLEISVCLGLVFAVLLSIASLNTECSEIRDSVLRLHVLATSDSAEDQALKLKVRDRILTVSEKMFSHAATKEEAVEDARNHLSLLQEEAQKVIFDDGYAYPVSVSLETSYFTTRSYGNVTLPAGEYQALRVVIGDGGGHNWWCVMFPPLCISAASEEEAQLSDVLSPEQMTLVESDGYEIKFKCVELYEEFRRALSRKSR